MLSKTDFIEKIQSNLIPELKKEDKKRKMLLSMPLFLILFFLVTLFLYHNSAIEDKLKYLSISLIIMGIYYYFVGTLFFNKLKEKYSPFLFKLFQSEYKQAIDEYNEYETKTKIFNQSLLFPCFDILDINENIACQTNSTHFSLSKITLANGVGKHQNTFFNGWSINISTDKIVNGYALFFNKKPFYKITDLNKIQLTNENYKKNKIFSDNETKAIQIFNPLFIEKINVLKKQLNLDWIGISYFGNQIMFAIEGKYSLFNPFFSFGSLIKMKRYEKFYNQMYHLFELIKLLNIHNDTALHNCKIDKNLYLKVSKNKKNYTCQNDLWIVIGFAILFPLILCILMNI